MNYLITGATGFLGKKICACLVSEGHQVKGLGRNTVQGEELKNLGAEYIQADLRNEEDVIDACKEIDIVIHSGALSSPWGPYKDFYDINVTGTENIIKGCEIHKVKRLVHISTPSVYFNFTDRFNVKESDPIADPAPSDYTATKLIAEKRVEEAFTRGLPTVSLRPRGLFGPGDTAIIPRLLKAYERGKLPIIGNGENYIDLTYIDNVVDACLLAAKAPEQAFGQKYNITNGEPVKLWNFIAQVLMELGHEFKPKKLPWWLIKNVAHASEFGCKTFLNGKEPTLTRYTAGLLAFNMTLDISKARKDLGYNPKVSMEDGLINVVKWWKEEGSKNEAS